MHHFAYRDGKLFAEEISVTGLAEKYGTPLYIYSAATLRRHFEAFDSAFSGLDHLTCFSVKANSNLSLLKLLGEMGAGMDIVSGGELYRALKAGIPGDKIVYSGVGKRASEIREGPGGGHPHVQRRVRGRAAPDQRGRRRHGRGGEDQLPVSTRTWTPQTHPYISTGMQKNKFGLDIENSLKAYELAAKLENIDPVGMDCHIGSQLTNIDPLPGSARQAAGHSMKSSRRWASTSNIWTWAADSASPTTPRNRPTRPSSAKRSRPSWPPRG